MYQQVWQRTSTSDHSCEMNRCWDPLLDWCLSIESGIHMWLTFWSHSLVGWECVIPTKSVQLSTYRCVYLNPAISGRMSLLWAVRNVSKCPLVSLCIKWKYVIVPWQRCLSCGFLVHLASCDHRICFSRWCLCWLKSGEEHKLEKSLGFVLDKMHMKGALVCFSCG